MPQVVVERLDHLGVIAGLVELIDSRIEVDKKEEITQVKRSQA